MRELSLSKTDRLLAFKGLLLLVLLLAFYLRVTGLGAKSLWQDEIFTVAIASPGNSMSEVVSIPLYNTALPAPPLYFLITHFFLYVGDNDFLLRFPAMLFGVLGVAATYALGARLFGKGTGLVGAFLLAISSLHVRYSQDARFYGLIVLLSLLSLYCLWRALFDRGSRWWAGFVVCTLLNIYTHLLGLFVLASEIVFVGGLWITTVLIDRRRDTDAAGTSGRSEWCSYAFNKQKGLAFPVSLAIVALLYGPMIPHLVRGLSGRKGLGGVGTPGLSVTLSFLAQLLEGWGNGPGLTLLLFLIAFVIGVVACAKSRRTQLWLGFCWLVVPFAVLLLVPARHGFRPRYVLFMLPLYLLFVGRGLMSLQEGVSRWRKRAWARCGGVCLVLTCLVLAVASLPGLRGYYEESRSDWKAVAGLLETSFAAGEMIVSPGPFPQVVLPRYSEELAEATFLIGGSEVFLSSGRGEQRGIWFVGPGRETMDATERSLRGAVPLLYKVVFEVDAESASQGVRLNVAPTMYSDLWVLYVREGLGAEELIERYEEALQVVPPSVASSVHTTLGDLYRDR